MFDRLLLLMALVALAAVAIRGWRRRPEMRLPPAGHLTVVYFWSPRCSACAGLKQMLAIVESEQGAAVQIKAINVNERQDEAGKWGVWTVPTLILVDGTGQVVGRESGAVPRARLQQMIAAAGRAAQPNRGAEK